MSLKHFIPEDVKFKRLVGPLFFSAAVFYLVFHALNGERGIYAFLKQSRNLENSQQELSRLVFERKALENNVKLLSNESLDLDLLDEQARRVLGKVNQDEIVVILEPRS